MRWLLVCALLFCAGCKKPAPPPRLLHVQVAAGPDLRKNPDWRDRIAARVRAASEMLRPANLSLELAGASEWEPDSNLPPEMNRWRLAGYHSSGDWLAVGFSGSVQSGSEPGLATAFDPRVLVFEITGAPEELQAAALAHEIGHVFGAWHARQGGTLMSLPSGGKLDAAALACFRIARAVDFRQGIASLSPDAIEELQKLWKSSGAEPATNPVYRFYSSLGEEQIRRRNVIEGRENLTKAVKYAPEIAKTHLDLGNVDIATRDYMDAVDEFRAAAKIDPHSAPALSGLAAAQIGLGRRNEALDTLTRSLQMNPGDAGAHTNLGVVLVGTPGRLDDGIAELREALRLNPNAEAAKHSLDLALEAKSKGRR